MSGFIIVVGLFLAGSILVGTVLATVGRVGAGGLRVAAGVVALLVLAVTAVLSTVRYVGEDEVGIVVKNVAVRDLPQGRIIATGGEKGPQAEILEPGWHFGYWPVIYDVQMQPVVEIKDDQVGLLTTTDGRPLPAGQIYAPRWTKKEFKKMIDAEYFLGEGQGYKGPQTSVLTPGKYRLNTKLFKVEKVPVTNVEKATVGVVKSNVGELPSAALATPDALVDDGQRGIWRQPRLPQEYYLNTKAYEVTIVSTAKRVVNYTGKTGEREQQEIKVRTSDGFDFPVDVRVEYEITPADAAIVVAIFGDDGDNLRKRLNSAVRAIFRNNAEAVEALDYVGQRSLQEKQSLAKLAEEMAKVGVTVTAVRIAGVAEDGSLEIKSTTTPQPSPRPADVPPPAITGRGQQMRYKQPAVYGEDPVLAIYLLGTNKKTDKSCEMLFQVTNVSGKHIQSATVVLGAQVRGDWRMQDLGAGRSVWFLIRYPCDQRPTFTLTSLQ